MQLGQLRKFVTLLGAAAQQSTRRVAVLMMVAAMLGANTPAAQESSAVLSPQALQEIAQVEAEIDRIEAQTMERLATPPDNQVQQIELIGKLLLYDKAALRQSQRGLCFLPHARGGLYRSCVGTEPNHRLLSRIGAHEI